MGQGSSGACLCKLESFALGSAPWRCSRVRESDEVIVLKMKAEAIQHAPARSHARPHGIVLRCESSPLAPHTWSPTDILIQTLWKSNTICSYLLAEDPPFSTPSPVDVVDSNYPPTAVVIASADKSIPPEQSYKLYDRLQSKGVESRVFVCEGMEHLQAESLANAPAWPADKEEQWWDAVTGNLDFVLRYLH